MKPPRTCPSCSGPSSRAIYAGFSMYLCDDPFCSVYFGVWSWVMEFLPFNGTWLIYEGWYLGALWVWFFGGCEGEL